MQPPPSTTSSSSSSRGPASFLTQANALLRKNLTFQKRNLKTNFGIVAFPFFLCAVIVIIQQVVNNELNRDKYQCGCQDGVCGLQYSTLDQVATCPIPNPPEWPVLLQVPRPEYRAVRNAGLPDEDSCRTSLSCPAALLLTGGNRSLAQSLGQTLLQGSSSFSSLNSLDYPSNMANFVLGTDTFTRDTQFIEPAFISDRPLYWIQPQCLSSPTTPLSFQVANRTIQLELQCVQGLTLWRDNSSQINDELFRGYREGNSERKENEYIAAYDFLS